MGKDVNISNLAYSVFLSVACSCIDLHWKDSKIRQ